MIRTLFFLILSLLTLSEYSFAQNIKKPPIVRMGDIVSDQTTYEKVLSNPQIIYDMPGFEVTSYIILILPKGSDLYGPYKTKGPELTTQVKSILEKLKSTPSRILIDSIRVINKDGK